MLLGTGGTAMADNISVVVRSWNDTEKQVVVKTETHDCEDISGWSDSGWPTMDGSQGEKWYYVKQNKTFGSRPLIAKGKVHLVIPDGVNTGDRSVSHPSPDLTYSSHHRVALFCVIRWKE